MSERRSEVELPWIERVFRFDLDPRRAPVLLERLFAAPWRAEAMMAEVSPTIRTARPEGGWSAQEHIGHLADLDELLFQPRLDAIEAGAEVLPAADLANPDTWKARHDRADWSTTLDRFRAQRHAVIERLRAADPAFFTRGAPHPRLERTMRVVDMMSFHAEHDDHHFASARALLEGFRGARESAERG